MDRETHYGVVFTDGRAAPTQDPKGRPTILVSGTYHNYGSSQTNTIHLNYKAAQELYRQLGEIL
ncbi:MULTISPECIES: hypothetical protein [unclassified Kitasatospora]|uniref:hypothetical protein n=1 Tax=unclassified Kitasatospora TaxID=2633591 RepID=UPI0024763E81|nr:MULTISPECIES: hypothetical protein [unclassified Kitasatospora]MDH6123831.1 hypothetical protein [Kitasatospora sp. GP82]MDH6576070.1 hypothetical protein [Kitasatospora sp. MAP5-34]